jgi:chromosomal replication initiation ATPase DnaA
MLSLECKPGGYYRDLPDYALLSNARQQAMYLINLHCKITLKRIGAYFNRDHSTVIYAIEVVEALSSTDKKYRAQLKELQGLI